MAWFHYVGMLLWALETQDRNQEPTVWKVSSVTTKPRSVGGAPCLSVEWTTTTVLSECCRRSAQGGSTVQSVKNECAALAQSRNLNCCGLKTERCGLCGVGIVQTVILFV